MSSELSATPAFGTRPPSPGMRGVSPESVSTEETGRAFDTRKVKAEKLPGSDRLTATPPVSDTPVAVSARTTVPVVRFPDFTRLAPANLLDECCRYFPLCPEYEEEYLNEEKITHLRQAYHYKVTAEKCDDEYEKDELRRRSVECYMASAQACLMLWNCKGYTGDQDGARLRMIQALNLDPYYTRGVMLFMVAEMLLLKYSPSPFRDNQVLQCLQEAAASDVGAASWRLGCLTFGYNSGHNINPDMVKGLKYFRAACLSPSPAASFPLRDYYMDCFDESGTVSSGKLPDEVVRRTGLGSLIMLHNLYSGMSRFESSDVFSEAFKGCKRLGDHDRNFFRGIVLLERKNYKAAHRAFLDQKKIIEKMQCSIEEKNMRLSRSLFMAGYSLLFANDRGKLQEGISYVDQSADLGYESAIKLSAQWHFQNRDYSKACSLYIRLSKKFDYVAGRPPEKIGIYEKLALNCLAAKSDEESDRLEEMHFVAGDKKETKEKVVKAVDTIKDAEEEQAGACGQEVVTEIPFVPKEAPERAAAPSKELNPPPPCKRKNATTGRRCRRCQVGESESQI